MVKIFGKKKNEVVDKEFGLFLRMGNVEVGPPISTILGNFGVNATIFCKDFNTKTEKLPSFFVLRVKVIVKENKDLIIDVLEPTTTSLLRWVCTSEFYFVYQQGGLHAHKKKVVDVKDIYMISQFKFKNCNINNLKAICGSARSLGLEIVSKE